MSTATGVLQQNSVARPRKSSVAARRSHALYLVLLVGALCLAIVVMSAFAANLRRVNNELQQSNEYLQAEIDSLENQIGEATNINKIESVATKELGMVHPDSQNCIALGESTDENMNLAATIKDEAYD